MFGYHGQQHLLWKQEQTYSPEIEPSTTVVVERPGFRADDTSHIMNELIIKGSAHQDWLWKRRGVGEVAITWAREIDTR